VDNKLSQFIKTDDSYKDILSRYTRTDGMLAIALYISLLLVYYLMGLLVVHKQIYLGIPVNLLSIAVCIALVLIRGQKPDSIGFTLKNIGKSILAGAVSGIVFTFFMNILPNILAGNKLIPAGQALYNIFYYFIVISLSEEVIFRGYIQTRIYGLIKRDIPAVITVGFLFYLMHLPFQITVNGMQISLINMGIIVALHCVMNFLYRRYNSLAAPAVFHGILDWGGNLLI